MTSTSEYLKYCLQYDYQVKQTQWINILNDPHANFKQKSDAWYASQLAWLQFKQYSDDLGHSFNSPQALGGHVASTGHPVTHHADDKDEPIPTTSNEKKPAPRLDSKIARLLAAGGFESYIVGGSVRDMLLGRQPKDVDLTTNAKPEQVMEYFRSKGYKVVPTGLKFGTVTVVDPEEGPVEITTYRTESKYEDGRRPSDVTYAQSVQEDLSRRDLTINSMAFDPSTNTLVDPHGGQADLAAGIIRAVGDPVERFTEDGLRSARAARFAAVLGFRVDEATKAAMSDPRVYESLGKVAKERIKDETMKAMKGKSPRTYIEILMESGLNDHVLPELNAMRGMAQPKKYHVHDVLEHSLSALDYAPRDPLLRFISLMHDVAKPETRKYKDDGTPTFHGHDVEGQKKIEETMRRLKFSVDEIKKAQIIIRYHLFSYTPDWKDKQIRKLVQTVGINNMDDLIEVRRADLLAHARPEGVEKAHFLDDLKRRIREMGTSVEPPKLTISGADVIELGVKEGSEVGQILNALRDQVMEDPSRNNPDWLIGEARRLVGKSLQ